MGLGILSIKSYCDDVGAVDGNRMLFRSKTLWARMKGCIYLVGSYEQEEVHFHPPLHRAGLTAWNTSSADTGLEPDNMVDRPCVVFLAL
jgi:hypothetical protein